MKKIGFKSSVCMLLLGLLIMLQLLALPGIAGAGAEGLTNESLFTAVGGGSVSVSGSSVPEVAITPQTPDSTVVFDYNGYISTGIMDGIDTLLQFTLSTPFNDRKFIAMAVTIEDVVDPSQQLVIALGGNADSALTAHANAKFGFSDTGIAPSVYGNVYDTALNKNRLFYGFYTAWGYGAKGTYVGPVAGFNFKYDNFTAGARMFTVNDNAVQRTNLDSDEMKALYAAGTISDLGTHDVIPDLFTSGYFKMRFRFFNVKESFSVMFNRLGERFVFPPETQSEFVDINNNDGVKVTLQKDSITNRATYYHPALIGADELATNNLIKFTMAPQDVNTPEATAMIIKLEDSLNPSQQISIVLAQAFSNSGGHAPRGYVSFTDKITFGANTHPVTGTTQQIIGNQPWTAISTGYNTYGNFLLARNQAENGYGVFASNPNSQEPSMQIGTFTFTYRDKQVRFSPVRWQPLLAGADLLADISDNDFLNNAKQNLVNDGGFQEELKARYTEDYVNNLFSSGNIKLSIQFHRLTGSQVSFNLISVGKTDYSESELPVNEDTSLLVYPQEGYTVAENFIYSADALGAFLDKDDIYCPWGQPEVIGELWREGSKLSLPDTVQGGDSIRFVITDIMGGVFTTDFSTVTISDTSAFIGALPDAVALDNGAELSDCMSQFPALPDGSMITFEVYAANDTDRETLIAANPDFVFDAIDSYTVYYTVTLADGGSLCAAFDLEIKRGEDVPIITATPVSGDIVISVADSAQYSYQYWIKKLKTVDAMTSNENSEQVIWQLIEPFKIGNTSFSYTPESDECDLVDGRYQFVVRIKDGNTVIKTVEGRYSKVDLGAPEINSVIFNGEDIALLNVAHGSISLQTVVANGGDGTVIALDTGKEVLISMESGKFNVNTDGYEAGMYTFKLTAQNDKGLDSLEFKVYIEPSYNADEIPEILDISGITSWADDSENQIVKGDTVFTLKVRFAGGGAIDEKLIEDGDIIVSLTSGQTLAVYQGAYPVTDNILELKFKTGYFDYGIYYTTAEIGRRTSGDCDDRIIRYYSGYARSSDFVQQSPKYSYDIDDQKGYADIGINTTFINGITGKNGAPDASQGYEYAYYKESSTGWTLIRDWGVSTLTWRPKQPGDYIIQTRIREIGNTGYEATVSREYRVNGGTLSQEIGLTIKVYDGVTGMEITGDNIQAGKAYIISAYYNGEGENVLYRLLLNNSNLGTVYLSSYSPENHFVFVPLKSGINTLIVRAITYTSAGYKEISVSLSLTAGI